MVGLYGCRVYLVLAGQVALRPAAVRALHPQQKLARPGNGLRQSGAQTMATAEIRNICPQYWRVLGCSSSSYVQCCRHPHGDNRLWQSLSVSARCAPPSWGSDMPGPYLPGLGAGCRRRERLDAEPGAVGEAHAPGAVPAAVGALDGQHVVPAQLQRARHLLAPVACVCTETSALQSWTRSSGIWQAWGRALELPSCHTDVMHALAVHDT
jgi:hypothetical protein